MRIALSTLVFAAALLIGSECAPSSKQLIKLRAGAPSPLIIKYDEDREIDWLSYFGGLHYFSLVELGTPGQKVNLQFNLHSTDIWTFSKACENSGCKGHKTYNVNASSTAGPSTGKHRIPFTTGKLVGEMHRDLLAMPGLNPLQQPLAVMSEVPAKIFDNLPFDGSIGLERRENINDPTFMNSLLNAMYIPERKSAFYCKDDLHYIAIGGYPYQDLDGDLTFAEPYSEHSTQWDLVIQGFEVERAGLSAPKIPGGYAQMSTSTPFVVGNKDDVDIINKQLKATPIGKTGLYEMPSCNTTGLPNISLKVAGSKFAIPPQYYVLKLENNGKCVSGFAATERRNGWLIGQPVIGPMMVTFDVFSGQIGFGNIRKD